jgi:hypothetical protein
MSQNLISEIGVITILNLFIFLQSGSRTQSGNFKSRISLEVFRAAG